MTTTNPIATILSNYPIMILDGALATELERHGYNLNDSLWSAKLLVENPEAIYNVHYDYFNAGADCATTASYQASLDGFALKGIAKPEAIALITKAIQLAQQARDDFWQNAATINRPKPIIAASIGPYGAYLADGSEYRGDYQVSNEILQQFHQERMGIVIEAGADVLACETLPSFQEIKVLLQLLKTIPKAYAWFSLSIKNPQQLCDGTDILEAVTLLNQSNQVAAIGFNCTAIENVLPTIETIKSATKKPIVVYPNSGESYDPVTKTWHGCSQHAQSFQQLAQEWVEAGAQLIGGCCRTTPNDIAGIAKAFRK